jgi:hypothetical protein
MPKEIWLEVSRVELETGKGCTVQLKSDQGDPEPGWWPVDPIDTDTTGLNTFKTILGELDKKRTVLAKLSWDDSKTELRCAALRFRSPEAGGR